MIDLVTMSFLLQATAENNAFKKIVKHTVPSYNSKWVKNTNLDYSIILHTTLEYHTYAIIGSRPNMIQYYRIVTLTTPIHQIYGYLDIHS